MCHKQGGQKVDKCRFFDCLAWSDTLFYEIPYFNRLVFIIGRIFCLFCFKKIRSSVFSFYHGLNIHFFAQSLFGFLYTFNCYTQHIGHFGIAEAEFH